MIAGSVRIPAGRRLGLRRPPTAHRSHPIPISVHFARLGPVNRPQIPGTVTGVQFTGEMPRKSGLYRSDLA